MPSIRPVRNRALPLAVAPVLLFASWATPAPVVGATPCELGVGPAATLLLPYFEVDPAPNGITTLFSVNNSGPEPLVARVTLWTDWGIPTVTIPLYLTGFDVVTLNLRSVLVDGFIPSTADPSRDPDDEISPAGFPAWDTPLPRCDSILPIGSIPQSIVALLQAAHTGAEATLGETGCWARDHGDGILRGFVTVDAATNCSILLPSEEGYFQGEEAVSRDNVLWGDFFLVEPGESFAHGDPLVHIQAFDELAGEGTPTFYGNLLGSDSADAREPLPSVFATRYFAGGAFEGGTELLVWRDPGPAPQTPVACGENPSWFPIQDHRILAFDEQESVMEICQPCGLCDPPPPPPFDQPWCAPLTTQRLPVGENTSFSDAIWVPDDFGWLWMDLDDGRFVEEPRHQAWVTTVHRANGLFSVGFQAAPLASSLCGDEVPDLGGL